MRKIGIITVRGEVGHSVEINRIPYSKTPEWMIPKKERKIGDYSKKIEFDVSEAFREIPNRGMSFALDFNPPIPSHSIKDRVEFLRAFWKQTIKSKTRYLTFTYKDRQITLCGKNTGNKIEVGYSVYCDNVLDKRKKAIPEDTELSKNIALGRLEKKPLYSLNVTDEPHRFIDTALDVARTKILKGELVIKGIR